MFDGLGITGSVFSEVEVGETLGAHIDFGEILVAASEGLGRTSVSAQIVSSVAFDACVGVVGVTEAVVHADSCAGASDGVELLLASRAGVRAGEVRVAVIDERGRTGVGLRVQVQVARAFGASVGVGRVFDASVNGSNR
jgi:hypothetical protein